MFVEVGEGGLTSARTTMMGIALGIVWWWMTGGGWMTSVVMMKAPRKAPSEDVMVSSDHSKFQAFVC